MRQKEEMRGESGREGQRSGTKAKWFKSTHNNSDL
jgi:hypothetical protein